MSRALGWLAPLLCWGCIVSEGTIGRDAMPGSVSSEAPAEPDAAPPDAAPDMAPPADPCTRCSALAVEAVGACLADGAPVDECILTADSCAGLCGQTEPCEACQLSVTLVAEACGAAGRADCDALVEEAGLRCVAACTPPVSCDECVTDAAAVAAQCHAVQRQGCGDAAAEVLAQCGSECAVPPFCVECFDAPIDCLTDDCTAERAVRMGDCVAACLLDCDGCGVAQETTVAVCADDPQCGALGELTRAVCESACVEDGCGACTAAAQRDEIICEATPGCESPPVELICGEPCGAPADECALCVGVATETLAQCEGDGAACEAIAPFLDAACAQVCNHPQTPCAECALQTVFSTAECAASLPAEACIDTARAIDACPMCDGCDVCVASADLEHAICRVEADPPLCDEMHAEAIERCECETLPDCDARVAAVQQICFDAGFEDICEALIATADAHCRATE